MIIRFFKDLIFSTIGRKIIIALTGLGLFGFVVMHLIGNLTLLTGNPDLFNGYSHKLISLGPILYLIESILLVGVLFHMVLAIMTTLKNRGASALMQGLADGYFVVPYTLGDYLSSAKFANVSIEDPNFRESENMVKDKTEKLLSIGGKKTVLEFHRELGLLLWEFAGMSRNEKGLKTVIDKIPELRHEFWQIVIVTGPESNFNKALEFAGRIADFLELGELIALDAWHRNESCGAHFREEYQTEDGEARRDDENYSYVAAWEYRGVDKIPVLH
jgi:hypothetical protein